MNTLYSELDSIRTITLQDIAVLAKWGITFFVALSAGLGVLYAGGSFESVTVLMLVGTALTSAGAGALNQYLEREQDALMPRTMGRPIPANRIRPMSALMLGLVWTLFGLMILALFVSWLSAMTAFLAWFLYVAVYTPMKRKTWLCNIPGAVAGALPTLIGWFSVRYSLEPRALVLFIFMFAWQWPHLIALQALYRKEYEQAGFSVVRQDEWRSVWFMGTMVLMGCVMALSGAFLTQALSLPWISLAMGGVSLVFLVVLLAFIYLPRKRIARQLFIFSEVYFLFFVVFSFFLVI